MRVRGSIAERGRSILINGVEVGKVCSSTWSPFQECGVGIVRMDDLATEAGLELGVRCIDGEIHSAQLCSLPMYDSKGGIVRGKNTVIPSRPEPWVG
jgi:aminomethyltransferase